MSEENIYWLADSEEDKPYETSTYLRVMKIEEFVGKIEKEHKIVGITFDDNNLGFILGDK